MAMYGPPPALEQSDLLAAIQRNFADHWITPLLADPSSSSLFIAMVSEMLRVSASGDTNIDTGCYILSAPGANPATCAVSLSRPPAGAAGSFPQNFRFRDTRGTVWVTTTPTSYSSGQQTLSLAVTTTRQGYYLNTFLPPTFSFYDVSPDANWVIVLGGSAASGGTSPFLDQHGIERSVFRAPMESDDTYRHRMLLIPDQVSPDAIAQSVIQVFAGYPATANLVTLVNRSGYRPVLEPFVDSGQPFEPGFFRYHPAFCDDLLFLDDASQRDIAQVRDTSDCLAWFDIYLPTLVDPNEDRFFLDVGYLDDPEFGYLDLPPGAAITSPLTALVNAADSKRAAGVRFKVVVGEDLNLVQHPQACLQQGAWYLGGLDTPTTISGALDRMDADASYAASITGAGTGFFITTTDLVVSTPPLASIGTDRTPTFTAVRVSAWIAMVATGVNNPPQVEIIMGPYGGIANRIESVANFPITATTEWQEVSYLSTLNPISGLPWGSEVLQAFLFGIANVATGTTDELRVSELRLEIIANYG